MAEFTVQKFEESGRENGIRYWLAHEFMRDLGYDSWNAFSSVIKKAIGSCLRLDLDPAESFIQASFLEDGSEVKTYKLTRFACFLVAMHADSKKPEVAQAKATLAAIADQLVERQIREDSLGRIEVRHELKLAEKVMSGAAKAAGLTTGKDFAIFKDAGFLGMYNMPLRKVREAKGVDGDAVLYDYMGLTELAGNLFRVTQTAERIRSRGTKGLSALQDDARTVGAKVRELMIETSGQRPEALPTEEPVGDLKKRLKSANRAMKKLDRPSAKPKVPPKGE